MRGHKLTNADAWFIRKGLKDALSRSEFSVGDRVVVCSNHHVMLEEFYSGECPTCQSRSTIPFSRDNVAPARMKSFSGECPKCNRNIVVLFRQQSTDRMYISRCPQCNRQLQVSDDFFRNRLSDKMWKKTTHGMRLFLDVLIVLVLVIGILGIWLNNISLEQLKGVLTRKMLLSDGFERDFLKSMQILHDRNEMLLKECGISLMIIFSGIKDLWEAMKKHFLTVGISRTKELCALLLEKTKTIYEQCKEWVENIIILFS